MQILDLFISKKIPFQQFSQQFYRLRGSNVRSTWMLKDKLEDEVFTLESNETDIQVNPRSYGFSEILSDLEKIVEISNPDTTLEENFEHPELLSDVISKELLRLRIENYYLPQLKKYCKKSKISYNIFLRTKIIRSSIFSTQT